ncbi:hypothetical protein N7462_010104 [Penicillium macrosclerotiorum]|uniref:uncharacterized protein n=1 Tax=Penicillium macrosclerotiorum TaxID=303699 RepID=UPI00254987F7|nr:uncharacterized protein N7462_010104 [Penicillium macrosclerotiorum]KAJ5669034.1 hypothetical protein N7462_010104 [Penicillium macrosclerotiorum]
MSFWYTDVQDHTGAWYWIGIAITLAQGIGIHRCTSVRTQGNQALSDDRQYIKRRLWWTCVVRDRWLSLAKGRPMRIHDEDCDAIPPGVSDILLELREISPEARQRFIPSNEDQLAPMWVRLVGISSVLGRILRAHYRLNGPKPSVENVDELFATLCEYQSSRTPGSYDINDTVLLHEYHLELFYQASMTVLCRPYLLNAPASLPEGSSRTWQKMMQGKARSAASLTNGILEKVIELDAVKHIKPMIITSLVPAMQVHLFDCKSTNSIQASLGRNKLQVCMLVLENLRNTYWSAGVMYRLFDRAQFILANRAKNSSGLSAVRKNEISSHLVSHNVTDPADGDRNGVNIGASNFANFTPDNSEFSFYSEDLPATGSADFTADFGTLEQLLNPGFSLPDVQSQIFFTDYTIDTTAGDLPLDMHNI